MEWRVLTAVKREFEHDEIGRDMWRGRAKEADVPLVTFLEVADGLNRRGVIGRFSTFLEHHKQLSTGERVTRFSWRATAQGTLAAYRRASEPRP